MVNEYAYQRGPAAATTPNENRRLVLDASLACCNTKIMVLITVSSRLSRLDAAKRNHTRRRGIKHDARTSSLETPLTISRGMWPSPLPKPCLRGGTRAKNDLRPGHSRLDRRRLVARSFFDLDDADGRDGSRGTSADPQRIPSPKFVNFASPTTAALVDKLSSYRREYHLPNGKTVTISPLTNELINTTADTLTEGFGDSMGYRNKYEKFLRKQIGEYLTNHIRMLPKALVLVAVLTDGATADAGEEPIDPAHADETAVLVGTCEVSFHPSTRSKHLTLNSPPDLPYLCNMAVREEHKGNGYGSMLLDACERVVLSTGYKSLYLHVRHVDKPALNLYRKYGYEVDGEDIGLVRLLGMDQRFLMKKYLTAKED